MDACTSLYPRVESERIMDSSSIRYFAGPGSWAMAAMAVSSRVGRKSRRGMGADDQPKLQRTTDLETQGPLAFGHLKPWSCAGHLSLGPCAEGNHRGVPSQFRRPYGKLR